MEKLISYYDWNKRFKKRVTKSFTPKTYEKNVNSLGIPAEEFRLFLSKWEAKNLS